MPNVIALQVGQCGNQLGQAFLAELCQRHGIGPDGVAEEKELDRRDMKDVFFYESDAKKYIYRCVLADLEPRVLTKVQNSEYGSVYNSENVYTASQGGGAGNAWASGYGQGREAMEAVMEIIQKEAEASDWLECFMLTHSVSGGTGSGMGSKLLESVRDCYPKKLLQAYSVFPVKGESNVVVEPYNAVLTTCRLAEYADLVMVVDNKALNQVAVGSGMEQASFETMNNMVAQMMGLATAPQRFGSTSCPTFLQQVSELSPFGAMHFIGTALFPFNIPGRPVIAPKTTSSDTLRRLLQPKSLMISALSQGPEYMISGQAIFEGPKEDIDVFRLKMDIRSKYRDLFPSWHGIGIRCLYAPPSPYLKRNHRVSGLLLANHTRFLNILDEMADGYDRLYAKNAYITQYEKEYGIDFINEMGESRSKIETLRELYREVADGTFMTPKPVKREGSSMQSSAENVNVS
ncbi:unnamed protein product [Bursaphelenchus xylophilus]|uniref:Tubulin gamma chain n=1 Tax=Bursaphelenchus xylophilus TaxID=6326 RepID=A0A1I7S6D7_BURXY|nr:unnamed protein product [Bursaphelenchus xylophilus]CAG9128101.1 unnamed protein product [Bursaphelenchus xylophilus]